MEITGDDRKGRLNRKPGEYHPSIAYTAIARVDLNIADDADIQINRISMDNIHREAFLLPQNPVSSPSGAALAKIDTIFNTPLKPG